jgi:V/A-type H+-transporting ATPase subunit B
LCIRDSQGGHRRTMDETLESAWQLLRGLPAADLKRLGPELLAQYGHAADQAASLAESSTSAP